MRYLFSILTLVLPTWLMASEVLPASEEGRAEARVEGESAVAVGSGPAGGLPVAGDPNELTPGESMAWRELRGIRFREEAIWERLREKPDDEDERQRANAEIRTLIMAYELLIESAPKFAEAYASYGLLLSRTGNREEAVRVFLRADQFPPALPMVKNQIGNYLFEEGRYKDALGYYLAAVQLAPQEPLYHYQLGTLLSEYRRFFLADALYTPAKIDRLIQAAFEEAARLKPEEWAFAYRHAESFYDLEQPDWSAALLAWGKLEARAASVLEKETIRLHRANVLSRMGQVSQALEIVDSIVSVPLAGACEQLRRQLVGGGSAEPPAEAPAPQPTAVGSEGGAG